LLGVGLLALLATGWQADQRAEVSLRRTAINQLTSIRAERKRQIEAYFAGVRRDVLTLAESRDVIAAMEEFRTAYRSLEAQVAGWPDQMRARYRSEVSRHYREAVVPHLRAFEPDAGPERARDDVPEDAVTIALQAIFIVSNPNPEASRDRLDRPAGGGRYAETHARFNPVLRSMARQFGYEDIFLIESEGGRIVYTAAKKLEFGTNLLSGPYRNTRLSRAFRAARKAVEADFVQLVDFESYAPSLGAPAAFVAAPVFRDGRRLGVVALQLPVDRINAVMTGDRKWEAQGLGRTGETYLVGPDRRMRSDSRFFLTEPQRYLETAAKTGVSGELLALMRTHQRTVLFQQITGAAAHAALSGQTGVSTGLDYREQPVLASYSPLDVGGLRWAIVAQLDTAEAFAPEAALRRALLATAAGVTALVVVTAVLLARSLTTPIRRLIAGMGRLGRGDLGHRLAEARRDEIGQIAMAFDRMASDLQETTVSRDHVSSILDSMSDAVIVVRPLQGGSDWRDATVVTVNPAACWMLGHAADEIVGQRVGSLISAITSATGPADGRAGLWLEDVLRDGRIGGREAVYKIHDGRQIPVLFSSAIIGQGRSAVGGVVCAAHDLTELKATEARSTFIRETFGRYVSDDVVASLLGSPEGLKLGGELRKVAVMMSDLRGFTALAERVTPEEAIRFLNDYLQTMVDLILHYRGTINEIMGDGILVIFGAPTAMPDDAERAVACAVAMQRAMDDVNARNREQGVPEIEMGIGIHTGEVIVGNIGSDRRMKYAAVGSSVNLTGRIESYTTGGQILISDSTRREVGSVVTVTRSLQIEPKGARHPLTVWEVGGIGGAHQLFLRQGEPAMAALAAEIPIRYAMLEDKHVASRVFDASFVALSKGGGEIRSAAPVPPRSNVKIWVGDAEVSSEAGEIYAKVVEKVPATMPGFVVRFTAVAPAMTRYLQRRLS
jgi:PAS domain S-box-containing protein